LALNGQAFIALNLGSDVSDSWNDVPARIGEIRAKIEAHPLPEGAYQNKQLHSVFSKSKLLA
jgi:hypothetical protein